MSTGNPNLIAHPSDAVPRGFRESATGSGLIVPEAHSRAREAWTKDELADTVHLPVDEAVAQKYGFIGRSGSGRGAMRASEELFS